MIQSQARAHPGERTRGSDANVSIALSTGMRLVWLLLFLGGVWLVIAGSPFLLARYSSICPDQLCFPLPQLNSESAHFVTRLGVSLDTYARAMTGFDWITVACWWLVGILLIWRRPLDPVALIAAFVSLVIPASYYINVLGQTGPEYILALKIHTFFNSLILVWLFALFPDGHWVPRWSRFIALAFTGYYALYALFAVPERKDNLLVALQGPLVVVTLGYVLAIQVYRYLRISSQAQRQQALWLLFSIGVLMVNSLVGIALLAFGHVGTWQLPMIVACYLGEITVPLALGVAVLRYRLFAIDILINRTLVYGALTTSVIGMYVLLVGSLSALFQANGSLLISLAATGCVAILFQPVRERLQRAVNRLMYGQRDEPYAVLVRLGRRLETTLAADAVLPTIAETVAKVLKLPYVAIEVASGQLPIAAAEWRASGTPMSPGLTTLISFPLIYQSETVGQLRLAPRAPGEPFSPTDWRLLDDLARQIGMAAHAVRLTADLQRSRERLVTAREEERRRLRRDLHDGLGPQLASQTLTLTAARQLLRSDPDTADALLTEATKHAQTAITDIRRLVYNLRPPALDDLGLVGALRAQTTQYGASGVHFTVNVDAPEPLPSLPAAVEVACYRTAQEALTNVVRHANARHCAITLTLRDDLRLEIVDDGHGLPPDRRAGVGFASMRERAEELGGTCVVGTGEGGGVRVVMHLPLAAELSRDTKEVV